MPDFMHLSMEWLAWIAQALLVALATMGWWMWRKLAGSIKTLSARIRSVEDADHQVRLDQKDILLAIANLRNHITENYASKPETNESLRRVHDKIEEMSGDFGDKVDQLRRDIKQDMRDILNGNGGKR